MIISLGALSSQVIAAPSLWKDVSKETVAKSKIVDSRSLEKNTQSSSYSFKNARLLQLDIPHMQDLLGSSLSNVLSSEEEGYANRTVTNKTISLPLPGGRIIEVQIEYSEVLPKPLADKYPEIKTFKLLPDDNIISGRVDITPQGFHAMVQLRDGELVFVDPEITSIQAKNENVYASYRKSDQSLAEGSMDTHQCLLNESIAEHNHESSSSSIMSNTQNREASRSEEHLLRYRIAIAATGEYSTIKGGKSAALSAIATTLNRVNQVYEQDLGIHLSLVDNNDEIIFTSPTSDPYTSRDSNTQIRKNQEIINNIIGAENYDLGHLFTTSGGGLAVIGSVCNNSTKAMGISGTANPGNDSFTLDFVAHEIGHQLGATHTFNSSEGLCSGNTRTARTAYEPGSGSTIMSYAGICGSDNLQSHADAMFHIGSIEQIRDNTENGSGSNCGIRATVNNSPPQPNAGRDYTIPANTPFELKGAAVDPEGDRLIYAWEQIDAGNSSKEFEDKGNNALFRAHLPNSSSSRSFPPVAKIISHRVPRGESLPIKERKLRFKLVAQDGYNAAQSDEMLVNVKRTGSRFALDLPRAHYSLGRDYRISWNKANTDRAPVYCDNVDVLLSTDGGYNFDYTLEEDVANTGETWVYLPSDLPETSKARFKLACSDNVFFAISYNNFRLTLDDLADASEPGPEADLLDKSSSGAVSSGTSTTSVSSSSLSTSIASSGGGFLNPLWLALLVLLRYSRRFL